MRLNNAIAHVLTKKIILVACFFAPTCFFAQNEEQGSSELLENFFRDNEFASESDAQLFLEALDQWRDKPLDLNRATREELLSMHMVNEIQVEEFLKYRDQFGPLLNELELQAIPNWDVSDIRRLMPFVRINAGLDARNVRLRKGLVSGENELLMRWGRPNPPNYSSFGVNKDVEGGPNAIAVRYRHTFDGRLRFGFTAENDPGEAFFNKSNPHGFDFYSAHLFAQNVNKRVKALALGDFSARFGQGLLLQTGFSPGKSAETVSIARGGRKLNAYAAFGETFFFRGGGATVALNKQLEFTALYSNRRRDGNIRDTADPDQEFADLIFTSLQTSGYHRDSNEIADEKALREQVGGMSLTYLGRQGQISVNALHIAYDKPWSPDLAAYRRYAFQGKNLTGFSADYQWRKRNFLGFGEFARSDNGGMATINGLLLSAHRNVTFSAIQRTLAKDYQSIYAAPFAEVSGAANETGLFFGTDIRWTRRWQLNFYADAWKHPWMRFGVGGPSRGREYLARVQWQKGKNFSVYVLYQSETKEKDSDVEGITGLLENRRDRFRVHLVNKVNRTLELRSRMEWSIYKVETQKPTYGYLAYEEAVVKPLGSPVSGVLRYTVFDTRNYDGRIYAYENDLF
ncbi:MAG: helix-hairpin-helix domain-containing protein, partial [Saprospiraceae bacterium]|nr:helix-hairpin-helix domain-containing protein [Saprospiraceae bacterium]